MFDTISKGFRAARERLTGKGELSEEVVDAALKDVRMSLLEADVEFRVVKTFLRNVKEKALGEEVKLVAKTGDKKLRVRPEDHFVRICHEELVELLGGAATEIPDGPDAPVAAGIETASKGVTGIMMVGLQGSGKTTTCGKLARKLQRGGKKVMLVAADVYRPAAVKQLQVIGEKLDVPVFAREGGNPVDICADATEEAAAGGFDFIIYDTAGRLTVDEALMVELEQIKGRVRPANIFLVIDAMIGQDAVNTAKAFDEQIDISGVVLTKLDGDARGGAALSIRAVTGKPIKFLGMGETLEKLETFRPDGLAGRILGMGDLVGLMEDFQEVVDEEQAAKDAEKMLGGSFTMDDFLNQIKQIQQMGSLRDLMDKIPLAGMLGGDVPQEVMDQAMDDKELVKIEAIIRSMTRKEREDPELFLKEGAQDAGSSAAAKLSGKKKKPRKPRDPTKTAELGPEAFIASRVDRVAKGSGRGDEEVRSLVSRFVAMRDMFGMLGDLMGGGGGLLGKIPGMKQMKQLGAMRKLAQNPDALNNLMGGGGPLGGMPPGMGMPGGMPGMPGMPGLGAAPAAPSAAAKAKAKAKRKKDKAARKKNRKR